MCVCVYMRYRENEKLVEWIIATWGKILGGGAVSMHTRSIREKEKDRLVSKITLYKETTNVLQ